MSVSPYGSSAALSRRATASFGDLKAQLATLQRQLTTGRNADSYADLGAGAATSLSARGMRASVSGYAANVADAQLRVKLMTTSVQGIARIATGLASSLPSTLTAGAVGSTATSISALDGLQQVIELLNVDAGGRYLFAGRVPDAAPVLSASAILDGDPPRAGLRQLVVERKQADLGAGGLGRLAIGGAGTVVGVGEEAAGLPFGMKLADAAATGTGIAATRSAGPPASVALSVAAQPADGDTVSLTLTLPDGSSATVTLTARSPGAAGGSANRFAIGATPADTAANLRQALDAALRQTASTDLASASTQVAASGFFAGSAANPPARIPGPSFATATATVPGTASDTVIWYRGDDGTGDPRATAPVRTGDSSSVAIGARASEEGIRDVLAALAALAADSFPDGDATSGARYAALASRVSASAAAKPAQEIATDLGVANGALTSAAAALKATRRQLDDTIGSVEDAEPNEVASKLLAVQTRLQASYQTTSAIAKLSLVNFL